jgi:hypothetical protein
MDDGYPPAHKLSNEYQMDTFHPEVHMVLQQQEHEDSLRFVGQEAGQFAECKSFTELVITFPHNVAPKINNNDHHNHNSTSTNTSKLRCPRRKLHQRKCNGARIVLATVGERTDHFFPTIHLFPSKPHSPSSVCLRRYE